MVPLYEALHPEACLQHTSDYCKDYGLVVCFIGKNDLDIFRNRQALALLHGLEK